MVAGFDAFLGAAQPCMESRQQIEPCYLKEHVAHVQQFRRHLEACFLQSDPLRPRTPLYVRLRPEMKACFEAFRQGMRQVEKFLEGRSSDYLSRGCGEAARALVRLRDLSHQLSQEEAGFPRPEGAVEDLLVMMDYIGAGTLEMSVVAQRVEDFRGRCRRYREDVAVWSRGKSQDEALLASAQRACRHLLELESSLEAVGRHARGEQLRDWDELKQQIRQSGEELQADYQEIMQRLAPDRACPQCGHMNRSADKLCRSCSAILPAPASLENLTTFSARESEPGSAGQRFAYLVQVEQAVESYVAGESDLADLQTVVNWFAQRVQVGSERAKSLPSPPSVADPEQRRQADTVKADFERGTAALQSCARDLQRFMASLDRELLSRALESLREGERLMGDVQRRIGAR